MAEKNCVCIVGGRVSNRENLGRLATEVKDYFQSQEHKFDVYGKDGKSFSPDDCHTIIYTEKDGERLQQVIDICQEHGINLINLATGVMQNVEVPENKNFVFVDAPNADIGILKQLKLIEEESSKWHPDTHIAVISEWHQYDKASTPGTAKQIAKSLEGIVLNGQIYSARSPREAILHGIPAEHLGGFGLHIIEIYEKANILTAIPVKEYKLEVLGRKSYAQGTYKMVQAMKKLKNGFYYATDLVAMKTI